MALGGFAHIIQALKIRDFRIFMTGQAFSQIGVWMQRVTIGWLTWELTHSPTWLGIMQIADLVPALFIGTISGVLADRFDRLTIIRITQAGCALSAIALFVMVFMGWSTIHLLFILSLIASSCIAINLPARLAIVPNLARREHLHAAVAINSLVSNAGRFIGPAIGGLAIVQWGNAAAFGICAFFFSFPAITLTIIKAPMTEALKSTGKKMLTEIIDGVLYTVRHPGIGPLMASLVVTSTLGRAVVVLFPGFSAEVFSRGADGQAWLTSMLGGGAIFGGLYMAQRAGVKGLTRIYIVNIGVIGTCLAAFVASDLFWLASSVTALLGASLIINGVSAQTLIQNTVEGHMRGRVASLYVMIQRGGQSLGGLILGVTADIVGLRWSVAGAAAVCLIFWVWSLNRARTMSATMET